MEKIIELKSRQDHNYLKQLSKLGSEEESKTYKLVTESGYIRTGNLNDGAKFIDPSGGPIIVEGNTLAEAQAVVKSIDWVQNVGYIITFE